MAEQFFCVCVWYRDEGIQDDDDDGGMHHVGEHLLPPAMLRKMWSALFSRHQIINISWWTSSNNFRTLSPNVEGLLATIFSIIIIGIYFYIYF